jgi:hypothetical protein
VGKFALLIGVSESSEEDLPELPSAIADIKAMESVLQNPDLGGFDSVTVMSNPTREEMELAIETLFTNCKREDLVLCYFSGHGVIDNRDGKFYLVLPQTRKARGELVRTTAVAGTFLQYIMTVSRSKHQVLILDSCFSAAIADGMTVKSAGKVDIHRELGGEGRAILTSSSALEKSVHLQGYDLSIYTHYLIEGIQTGAANQNGGDYITVKELHEYVEAKLKLEVPQMSPQFFPVREGYEINLVRSPKPTGNLELEYRKQAERLVTPEGFTIPAKRILMELRLELGISDAKAEEIEAEVLRPHQEYRKKQKEYYDILREILAEEEIPSPEVVKHLAELHYRLGLKEEDAVSVERRALNGYSLNEFITYRQQKTEQDKPELSLDDTEILRTTDGKEIDYTTLRDLLKSGNWEEANRETQRVMLKVANSEKYLNADSLKGFPCPHLQKIDQLWVSASKNHFGFSVQEEIWRKYDSLNNYRKQGEKFREEVGWDIYYNVHTLSFDTKSPRGHLPCCDSFCWTWEESLSDRLLRMWHGSGGGSTVYRAGGGIYPNTSRGYNAKSKKVLNYAWQKILFMRVAHCSQQDATLEKC